MTKFWLGCALWLGLNCSISNAGLFSVELNQTKSFTKATATKLIPIGLLQKPETYLKACEAGNGIWTSTNSEANSFQQFEIIGHSPTNGIAQISKVSNDKVVWVSRGAYRCLGSPLLCSVVFTDRVEDEHSAKTILSKDNNSVQFRNFQWDQKRLAASGGLDAFWQAGHTPGTDGDAIPDSQFVLTECKK